MQMIKTIWPEWSIEKEIGKGSYGTVYKCINEAKEYCAIKVISIPQNEHEMSEVISEKMSVEQSREYYKDIADDLIKEIEILKALKGTKNIVEIYDAQIIEKEDGIGWNILIRMELLTDFNTYISDKQLTEKDVIKLGADLGNALSVCHKAKIIHRDIKPENILVDDEGNFKLGDFGVAKQMEKTQGSMSVKGTYNYMSPEVFAGKKCDGRADLYSLALVMYKLLNNNRLPFIDPNKQLVRYSERQAAFEKRINGEELPPVQGVSNELNAVILKACAFKPTDRQKDIEEFNKELGFLVEGKRIINKKLLKKVLSVVACVTCIVSVFAVLYYFTEVRVQEVESDVKETDVLKEEVGRTYNKIDYDADGQHLLYFHKETDEDYNNIPYLVDVENGTAVDICELLGEDDKNIIIGPRDKKYIYYAVRRDKYYGYSYEIQPGYDLYRYNKEAEEEELLLSSDIKYIEDIVYADDEYVYFCEYDDTSGEFLIGAPILKKYNIEGKDIMPIGDGVAYAEQYNGYIFYTADCGMTVAGYENLWVYDTYTNKNSLITKDWALLADIYFEDDTIFFEEAIVDESAEKGNEYDGARHCIVSYSFKTGEKTIVGEISAEDVWYFQDEEEGQVSYAFNHKFAIIVAGDKKAGEDVSYDVVEYILNFSDGTYNKIEFPSEEVSFGGEFFIDEKISENILYLKRNDTCYCLYEIFPSGIMKQYGNAVYLDDEFFNATICDGRIVLLTGDKNAPVKIYDFLEAEAIDDMEFVENGENEYMRVTEDVEMRILPSDSSEICGTLNAGDFVVREAISDSGWSRVYGDEYGIAYVRTENLEIIPTTDTSGLCGEKIIWNYNKDTRELSLTGKGVIDYYGQGGFPWNKYSGSVKKLTISKGIIEISDYAFFNFDSLKSITIPDGVEYIGSYAFSESESLTDVTLPNTLITISDDAFSRCKKLKNITIPDSVTELGQGAFCECESLESIVIPYGVTKISDYMFYLCTELQSVIISDSVTYIGNSAFSNCSSLTSIEIPYGVVEIGDNAFEFCTNIRNITIPDSVVILGSHAFYGCDLLNEVNLSAGLTRINSYTFEGCGNLNKVTIGSETTDIGENAFYDCYNLTEVYYTGTEEQWNSIAIEGGNDYLTQCDVTYNA